MPIIPLKTKPRPSSSFYSMFPTDNTQTAVSTPSSLGVSQPGETSLTDFFSAFKRKETYGLKNVKQTAKETAKTAKAVITSLPKSAVESLVVKPAVRTAQVISEVIKPGSAADKDVTFKAPFGLGIYNIPAQKIGVEGVKQVVGQGLEAAAWLSSVPKFAMLGKATVTNSVFKLGAYGTVSSTLVKNALWQAVKEGAKNGAYYGFLGGLGDSLQQDKNWTENAKDAMIGTIFGTALGATLSGGIAGVTYAANKAKFLQHAFEGELVKAGVSPERARAMANQSGFFGKFDAKLAALEEKLNEANKAWVEKPTKANKANLDSIKSQYKIATQGGYVVPGKIDWTPDMIQKARALNRLQGTPLPDFTKPPEAWYAMWLGTVPEGKWNPKPPAPVPLMGKMPEPKPLNYGRTPVYQGAAGGGKPAGLTRDVLPQFDKPAKLQPNLRNEVVASSTVIPEFKGGREAIEFGVKNKSNPKVIKELTKLHDEGLAKAKELLAKGLDDEAYRANLRVQTLREALEGAQGKTSAIDYLSKNPQAGFVVNPFSKKTTVLDTQVAKAKELLNLAKTSTGGNTERVFKNKQFDLDLDQNINLDKIQKALNLDKRTVRTFADMTALAQGLQTDIPSLLKTTKTLQITDAEVKGISDLIKTNSSFIKESTKALDKVTTSAEKTLLQTRITAAENQIKASLVKLRIGNTENGRAIVANRILAQHIDNPTFWYAKAAKTLNEGGKDFTPEVRTAIDDLIKNHDLNGLSLFIGNLRTPTAAEKAITLWKAGLLTSPTTHLANLSGNVGFAGLENVSSGVATGFDKIASLITGKRTKSFSLKGLAQEFKGAVTGLKKGMNVLKTGHDLDTALTKAEIPRQVNFQNKFLDHYTKTVFGALSAEDKIFKEAALKGSLFEQAQVNALNEGLKGNAFKLRVKELFLKPTDEMTMQAIDASMFRTFNNKNALATAMSSFKNSLGPGGKIATEFTAPFVRTPTNIAARMVDYSPLGFLKTITEQIKPETRGQKAFVEGLARNVTGTGIIALGTLLAEKGLMTGNKLTDQEKTEGKVPNGIKIRDTWFQIARISPVGNLLSLGAEYNKLSQDQSGVGLGVSTAAAGGQQLLQQTFLKGISGVLNVINDPSRYGESFAENTVGSLVPSIVGRLGKIVDPKVRNPKGIIDAVKSRIPFLSKDVAVRRDIFGAPVKVGGGRLNPVDPFNTSTAKDDPVLKQANEVGANLTMPSQTVSGIKLDNKEYDVYTKVQGKILKVYLDALIKSPGFQGLADDDKAKQIEHLQDNVRSEVNKSLFTALMVKRYKLNMDTDPEQLKKALTAFSKETRFKNLSIERQGDVISGLLRQN